MSLNKILLMAALGVVSCGRAPEVSETLASAASHSSVSSLQVHCRKSTLYSRGLTLNDSITLAVDGKDVKLNRISSLVASDKTTTTTQSMTGKINSIFDGTVVKRTHATILLNPTTLATKSTNGTDERKLRYALIRYSEGKLTVLDADSKPIMTHSICRTVQ